MRSLKEKDLSHIAGGEWWVVQPPGYALSFVVTDDSVFKALDFAFYSDRVTGSKGQIFSGHKGNFLCDSIGKQIDVIPYGSNGSVYLIHQNYVW